MTPPRSKAPRKKTRARATPLADPLQAARATRRARVREATRATIVEGARAVVMRDGIARTTLDTIAAELGLTKQGLYYHFESKEALLVELCFHEWASLAEAIHAATHTATSGADALCAIVTATVEHYQGQLELFRLATLAMHVPEIAARIGANELERVRPLNDHMYAPTEHKLTDGQHQGLVAPQLEPRRLAFVAHASAMGLLTMKAMVESVSDPLRHSDTALVAELCRSLRASCEPGSR